MKHKHAELIKAWADGAEIEYKFFISGTKWSDWLPFNDGCWSYTDGYEFRIKPEPKPDVILYQRVAPCQPHPQGAFYAWASCCYSQILNDCPNVKLTFDGETGELKSAEVLK